MLSIRGSVFGGALQTKFSSENTKNTALRPRGRPHHFIILLIRAEIHKGNDSDLKAGAGLLSELTLRVAPSCYGIFMLFICY
jgi:hypothetical protein